MPAPLEPQVAEPAGDGSEVAPVPWWTLAPDAVAAELGSDLEQGLDDDGVAAAHERHGPNALDRSAPPSWWASALHQVYDPMNLMLLGVTVVSAAIGQGATAVVVGLLVVFNVAIGAQQEMRARRSVDALATMQVPQIRVRRAGSARVVPSTDVVPGDLVELEAGDLVPADARVVRAASLEAQESALTGESVPVVKQVAALDDPETPLADRTPMVYQNTSVTRGTATVLVVGTGMSTEMGRIASMLTSVTSTRSPLQRELGSLTKVLGTVAWVAVAVIVVIGLVRGQEPAALLFLATAVAISAIPTGMPTFVQGMLAWGARRLAEAKAVVASLADVETLGATSAICSDKTGTLTLNEMTARVLWVGGEHLAVTGEGYSLVGSVLRAAGDPVGTAAPLGYGLCLPNDASVSADGEVVGDPTEAALVVLAAKLGVDATETRRAYPRVAEVPFDSEYKYMATYHRLQWQGEDVLACLVKGAPDVVLERCSAIFVRGYETEGIEAHRDEVTAQLEAMSARGLRTLAVAARRIAPEDQGDVAGDPQAWVDDLVLVAVVGIVDPLRTEAKAAVAVAQGAGIEVRMITGDHAVTAGAIGAELGLGAGAVSGVDLDAMDDGELSGRLDDLHVFGRVTPQHKLRLVQLLQRRGDVVAMTGDAVNDAAAIKQADVGVAMGSGSEVTKQAARLVLTDDNFATLVHAVELGRTIYGKITGYLRFQMTQLFSLIMLFLAASVLNIADGVAMRPVMVLFLNFVICVFPVVAILVDRAPPGLMRRPPRDPAEGIGNRTSVRQWLAYGFVLFAVTLVPLVVGPDTPAPYDPSASMTMAFVVMGLGTVATGLLLRRDPESGLVPPIAEVGKILVWPAVLVVLATELGFLQRWLLTQSLTGHQWLACLGLVAALAAVIEASKWLRRRAIA